MTVKTRARDSIVVFLIAFGLLGLFLWTGYLRLDNDALYADVARGMVASGDWFNPQIYSVPFLDKPPFLYWLVGSSIRVLGESSLSVRLTSAIFGALAVMLVYLAATADRGLWTNPNERQRSLSEGRTPGLIAAAFLIGVPVFAEYSRRVYMEVPVSACVFASIAYFDRAAARLNAGKLDRSAFVLAGALTGAGFMFKSLVGLFGAIPSVLFMVIVLRRRVFSKAFVLGGGLALISFLAVVAPWHVEQLLHQPEVFTEFTWKLHVEEQVLAAQPWSTGPPWF
ncbi:MAG: glycosyltransferase family 39 protein, partial [Myxococcales bacterium]